MTKRSQSSDDRPTDRRGGDRKDRPVRGTSAKNQPSKELRKALQKEAEAERRLVEREQLAADKVERARQGLSEAVEKLAKAQGRVSRRADRLAEAEGELRLRQREREHGPHRSGMLSGYEPGEADSAPAQGVAADLGLVGRVGSDGDITEPGQGAAVDAGLVDAPRGEDDDAPARN